MLARRLGSAVRGELPPDGMILTNEASIHGRVVHAGTAHPHDRAAVCGVEQAPRAIQVHGPEPLFDRTAVPGIPDGRGEVDNDVNPGEVGLGARGVPWPVCADWAGPSSKADHVGAGCGGPAGNHAATEATRPGDGNPQTRQRRQTGRCHRALPARTTNERQPGSAARRSAKARTTTGRKAAKARSVSVSLRASEPGPGARVRSGTKDQLTDVCRGRPDTVGVESVCASGVA